MKTHSGYFWLQGNPLKKFQFTILLSKETIILKINKESQRFSTGNIEKQHQFKRKFCVDSSVVSRRNSDHKIIYISFPAVHEDRILYHFCAWKSIPSLLDGEGSILTRLSRSPLPLFDEFVDVNFKIQSVHLGGKRNKNCLQRSN